MGSAQIRFNVSSEAISAIAADGVVVPVFKKTTSESKGGSKSKGVAKPDASESIIWPEGLSPALVKELTAIANDEKFDGGAGKTLTLRASSANGLKARRLILLGLGQADKLEPRQYENYALKAVASALTIRDPKAVVIALPNATEKLSLETSLSLTVDAVHQATYKSMEAKDPVVGLKTATLLISKATLASLSNIDKQLQQAGTLAKARSLVKDLVNHPANLKTTKTLADKATALGKLAGVTVTIQNDVKWIAKNMPCFYTVARGSVTSDPPRFIQLRYQPSGGKAKKHIAVVGKSVIFDTGGYQVKPGDAMVTMKGDMTGGSVALGVMQALSELKLKNIEVSAYLAATPNKIDSNAMIPDSIVDTTCGKKVEIRHTDAEGRLTLIDAVAKAAENKPAEIITIATLTGAAMVAVGHCIALMANDIPLRDRLEKAGRSLGEPIQTLDVLEDDFENIKSKLDGADIINTSQRRHRGAQTAAAFVMNGAPEGIPLAHLDIAGADMTPDEKATGTSVKTILQYLLDEDERLSGSNGGKTPTIAASKKAETTVSKKPATKTTAKKPAGKTPAVPKKPTRK